MNVSGGDWELSPARSIPASCCCYHQGHLSFCEVDTAELASYAAILGLGFPIHKMGIMIPILSGSPLN